MDFQPAARLQGTVKFRLVSRLLCCEELSVYALVTLLEIVGPVFDRARHEAGEDEVELLVKRPGIFQVIDVESDIGWDATCIGVSQFVMGSVQ